jgi:hypothetical protein
VGLSSLTKLKHKPDVFHGGRFLALSSDYLEGQCLLEKVLKRQPEVSRSNVFTEDPEIAIHLRLPSFLLHSNRTRNAALLSIG